MMESGDKKLLKDAKVIPNEEVFTQHMSVVCDLSLRIEKEAKKLYVPKLKVWKLKDAEVKQLFVSVIE